MSNQKTDSQFPPQHQEHQPGRRSDMRPKPKTSGYQGCGKLKDKVALVTGGDSGIGRAVAIAFAKEGADVAFLYLEEHEDAEDTKRVVEGVGRKCLTIHGDIGDQRVCKDAVKRTTAEFGGLNILVNNAAVQFPRNSILEISQEQLEHTFRINIFSMFYMTQAALEWLQPGDSIINTTSVTAYRGSPHLLDYSATKGAIVAFTRSLSINLLDKEIRVNAVAPGPIWTPLIPASFEEEHVAEFGAQAPMNRAGQPEEVAPSFVFLASQDSSYMSGQVLHPNGGEVING